MYISWNDNFGSAQTGLQKNCLKPTSNIPAYQKGTHDSVDMHLWLHIRACWPPGSLSSYSQVCFETTFSNLLSLCFGLSQMPLDSFSFLSYLQYKSSLLTMERPFQEFLHIFSPISNTRLKKWWCHQQLKLQSFQSMSAKSTVTITGCMCECKHAWMQTCMHAYDLPLPLIIQPMEDRLQDS